MNLSAVFLPLVLTGAAAFAQLPPKVLVADVLADGSLATPRVIADDLPDGSQHPYRTIAFGPDGKLYVTVGSQCNNCVETNPEAATVVRMNSDGSGRSVFARGLRNTLGFAFNLLQPGAGSAAEHRKAQRPAQFGRIAGLAVAADGALLVSEDQNGVIYRISHGDR